MDAETLASPSAPPFGVAIKTEIVVIGAGQAGLSSAYHLKRRGLEVGRGFAVPLAVADPQHRQSRARPARDAVLRGGGYQQ
jgi:2-polyprenyl-6-methoxyphenol hydroxylase-like FAD-dependent oxidoreductase